MSTTTFINDQPWETSVSPEREWAAWVEKLQTHLGEKGWVLHRARLDGAEIALGKESPLHDASSEAPVHELRVDAGPAAISVDKIDSQLRSTLPRFREELESLAGVFSRGDWKSGLERLHPLLEEFEVALTGLQLASASRQDEPPRGTDRIPELLEQLAQAIASQSWVDVSDCLLYELVPLVGGWHEPSGPGGSHSGPTDAFPAEQE